MRQRICPRIAYAMLRKTAMNENKKIAKSRNR